MRTSLTAGMPILGLFGSEAAHHWREIGSLRLFGPEGAFFIPTKPPESLFLAINGFDTVLGKSCACSAQRVRFDFALHFEMSMFLMALSFADARYSPCHRHPQREQIETLNPRPFQP